MTNQPLNSSDQSKIVIFFLLLAPAVVFLVGAIPALLLGFGIFMMKKNEDFSHIETAVRNFRGYTLLLLTGFILLAAYSATTLNAEDSWDREDKVFVMSLVFSAICIAYLIFVKAFFLKPLASHSEWVEKNGFFSSKSKSSFSSNTSSEVDIIKGEKLKQYSVADELIKWAKLKEDGYISDDEFNEARAKLLKRS